MVTNPVKTIFWILALVAVSVGVVTFFNRGYIEIANKTVKVVDPNNYTDSTKKEIKYDDIVEITGTPNLLNQVSQEPTNNDADNKNIYYYVGLKEYGYDFVVRIRKGKLNSETQTFRGIVKGLSSTEFGTRIKNSLNKPINFEDSVNDDAASELDAESQEQIATRSEAKFTDASLLILDEETINLNGVYANIIFWSSVLSIFLITFFRKSIFEIRSRK